MKTNENNLFDAKLDKLHKDELGLSIPKDYFKKSNKDILKIIAADKNRVVPLYKNKIVWAIAASFVLIITLTVYKPSIFNKLNQFELIVSDTIEQLNKPQLADADKELKNDNVLLSSLFVADDNLDAFVDDYVYTEIIKNDYK
ncbi:MAG: hypothetical protein L3J45_05445 [Flavobacteriaceae bacterium]|nr:hypothetical protein [Flavobacteriaceae bacterium]